ncbi:MAG: heterodisulfide reductase subunit E, partial [Spirochaetia bacterium]|nr:heterodisulfide reductase subunit E [Spirochaetia bacterium]
GWMGFVQRSTPLELDNPVKILGNVGAVLAFIGTTLLVVRRFTAPKATGIMTFYDSSFLFNFYLVIVTGIGAELARLGEMPAVAFGVYFIHLVTIFYLLAYLPFTKFAHLLYRTTAMVYAKASGRN